MLLVGNLVCKYLEKQCYDEQFIEILYSISECLDSYSASCFENFSVCSFVVRRSKSIKMFAITHKVTN
jgi:hypothetical protein